MPCETSERFKVAPAFLSYDDPKGILSWYDATQALRQGHLLPQVQLHHSIMGPADGMLLNCMARIEGVGYGVKVEFVFGANAAKGHRSHPLRPEL